MKKTLLTLTVTLFSICLFGQNENPYSIFGYEAPIMKEKSKINKELFVFQISNSNANAEATYLVIEPSQRLVKYYDQNGSLLIVDTLNYYSLARWLTTDPAGQYYSPYMSMGNNPILGIDPNGAESSPIFDFEGNHLGNDSEGFFGEVIYMDPSLFSEGMDHGKVLDMVSNGEAFTMNGALGNELISIHALRNTIDNIVYVGADMYDIDLSLLYNGKVSIHSYASIYSNATWDCWESQRGATANASAYMEGNSIKVNYFVRGGTSYSRKTGVIYGGANVAPNMTHSGNILSAFVHEYIGHGNGGNMRTAESAAYNAQRWHLSFNHVTPAYRTAVITNYNYYNGR